MNFNKLITDSKEGLKRNIFSRREKKLVSVEEFDLLSKKYFNQIKRKKNLIINFDKKDKETLVFILRWYYNLWIDVDKYNVKIYFDFPKEFEIIKGG